MALSWSLLSEIVVGQTPKLGLTQRAQDCVEMAFMCAENCAAIPPLSDFPGWVDDKGAQLVPYVYCTVLVVVLR